MTSVQVIATARPTFAIDVAAQRAQEARQLIEELGANHFGPTELVMDDAGVAEAKTFVDPDADLILHLCASFCDASPAVELYEGIGRPILLWAFREPGPVGDRLWLNSLCGANLIGHALVRAGEQVRLLYGNPDEPQVREALARALAGDLPEAIELPASTGPRASTEEVEAALTALRGQRIGVVGEAPVGFTPSEYDPELLRRLFGLETDPLSLDDLFASIASVPENVRAAELNQAREWQPSIDSLEPKELDTFAAVTVALRDWHSHGGLSALAVRCWPEFPTQLGVCPCSAMSRMADEQVATQCERDVYGAATMLLMSALGSGMTYLVDTVDMEADTNIVRFWHCGSAATELADDPDNATQYIHCNRKIGVVGNFPLKTGQVVAARLTEDPERPGELRMLITSGESIEAPNRFQGNTADVRLDTDASAFVHGLVTGGFPHHTVLSWKDIRPGLRAVADALSIPIVEF